jgi:hypothetical protein
MMDLAIDRRPRSGSTQEQLGQAFFAVAHLLAVALNEHVAERHPVLAGQLHGRKSDNSTVTLPARPRSRGRLLGHGPGPDGLLR